MFRQIRGSSHRGLLLLQAVVSVRAGGSGGKDVEEDVHLENNTEPDTLSHTVQCCSAKETSKHTHEHKERRIFRTFCYKVCVSKGVLTDTTRAMGPAKLQTRVS